VKIPKSLWWIAGGLGGTGILAFLALWWLIQVASVIPGASDYTTKLPNGYFLMRQWRGSSLIFQDRDRDHIFDPATEVGPSQYGILMAVTGRYIVGNLDTEEAAYKVPEVPDRYFIIDTQNDRITKELSFDEYERRMHELGFEELPRLIRPNQRTRFVSR
jgi:hypothetical protein